MHEIPGWPTKETVEIISGNYDFSWSQNTVYKERKNTTQFLKTSGKFAVLLLKSHVKEARGGSYSLPAQTSDK